MPSPHTLLQDALNTKALEDISRFPSWELQDSLLDSLQSNLLLGVPHLAASPNIRDAWHNLDPTTWTTEQINLVENAPSGVLFLSGLTSLHQAVVDIIYEQKEAGANWLILYESGVHNNPYQLELEDELGAWASALDRYPGKLKLWQHNGTWATSTPPPTVADKGLQMWLAGCKPPTFNAPLETW